MKVSNLPGLTTIDQARREPSQVSSQWDDFIDNQNQDTETQELREKFSFGDLVNRSMGLDHIIPNISQSMELAGMEDDPGWVIPDSFFEDLELRNIPVSYAEDFEEVFSEEQYAYKLRMLGGRVAEEQTLASMGGRGLAARIAGGFTDPALGPVDVGLGAVPAVVNSARAARGASTLNRAGVAVAGGVSAGAVNVAATAAIDANDPSVTIQNYLIDFGAGMALGALGGAAGFTKPETDEYLRTINKVTHGGDDSAGAARVEGFDHTVELDAEVARTESATFRELEEAGLQEFDKRAMVTTGPLSFLRRDVGGQLEKSPNTTVRKLKRLLVSDGVGFNKGVNESGAIQVAERLRQVSEEAMKRDTEAALKDFLGDSLKGKIQRQFDIKARDEFYERVGRAIKTRGESETDPNVLKAMGAVQRTLRNALDEMKKAGVKGADEINPDDFYFPRVFNRSTVDHIKMRFRKLEDFDGNISKLIGAGIRSALRQEGREVSDEITDRVAAHYLNVIKTGGGQRHTDKGGRTPITPLNEGYLDEILEAEGLDPESIEMILDQFRAQQPKDAAQSNRLKTRLKMDESVSIDLEDGTKLYLHELFDNNAERVMNDYLREMSGRTALARAGFKSESDLNDVIEQLGRTGDVSSSVTPGDITNLNFLKDSLLGRSLENDPSGTWAKAARTVRDWNFLRSMGSVGWSMLAEFGTTVGYAGLRATLRQVPALKQIIADVKNGTLSDALARELAAMGAPGSTMLRNPVSIRYEELGFKGMDRGKAWKGLDNASQVAKRLQTAVSGLGPLNDIMQRLASRAMAQRLFSIGTGAQKLRKADAERLRDYGLSDEMQERLWTHMKTKAKANKGTLEELNVSSMDPDLREAVELAMFRSIRHIIQEGDAGSSFKFMHSTGGKILSQFRSFMLTAYTRHTLHGAARMDAAAGITLMTSMMFATLGYVGRVHVHYANDPDRREELLSFDRLAKVAFQNSASASVIPIMIDTAFRWGNQDPMFGYAGRSTNLETGAVLGNPTIDTFLKAMTAMGIPAAAISPNQEVTEEQMRSLMSLFWLSNVSGAKNFISGVSRQFPSERD